MTQGKFKKVIRNCFILILCTISLCHGLFSLAYGADKPVIAIILSSSIGPYQESLQGFHEKLKKEGVVYEFELFTLDKDSDKESVISSIKSLRPDLVHTIGTRATQLAKDRLIYLPVIFSMVLNPEASGLVESMSSPGGNITGASMDIPFITRFKKVRKLLPGVKKIGVIYSESETGPIVEAAAKAAGSLGMKLFKVAVKGPSDVPMALEKIKDKADLLWSVADSNVFTGETVREILLVSLREKIPFIGLSRSFVKAGALAAFETDHSHIGKQAGGMAKRILGGKKPASITVTVPENIKILLNSNTLDILGMDIPKNLYISMEIIKP